MWRALEPRGGSAVSRVQRLQHLHAANGASGARPTIDAIASHQLCLRGVFRRASPGETRRGGAGRSSVHGRYKHGGMLLVSSAVPRLRCRPAARRPAGRGGVTARIISHKGRRPGVPGQALALPWWSCSFDARQTP